MPQIEIRPLKKKDITILKHIDHAYQTEYVWQMDRILDKGQFNVCFREIRLPRSIHIDYPRTPEMVAEEGFKGTVTLVAVHDTEPVGYINAYDNIIPSSVWVTDLAIQENQRQQGFACGLVLAIQEWAAENNHRRVILEMQSKNYPAIQLALKLGYEFSGYQDHYYANHDIALFFSRYVS